MTSKFFAVREDLLPEAIVKTLQVKSILSSGEATSINEAVEKVNLSRSAFYKYKDGVYALSEITKEHIITVGMDLMHRSGVLSQVLSTIASQEGNVLTINQSIPLQGYANVVLTVDVSRLSISEQQCVAALKQLDGVRHVKIIGQAL